MRKWMEVTENPQEKDNFFFFLAASVLVWLVQVGTGLSGLKQCFSH